MLGDTEMLYEERRGDMDMLVEYVDVVSDGVDGMSLGSSGEIEDAFDVLFHLGLQHVDGDPTRTALNILVKTYLENRDLAGKELNEKLRSSMLIYSADLSEALHHLILTSEKGSGGCFSSLNKDADGVVIPKTLWHGKETEEEGEFILGSSDKRWKCPSCQYLSRDRASKCLNCKKPRPDNEVLSAEKERTGQVQMILAKAFLSLPWGQLTDIRKDTFDRLYSDRGNALVGFEEVLRLSTKAGAFFTLSAFLVGKYVYDLKQKKQWTGPKGAVKIYSLERKKKTYEGRAKLWQALCVDPEDELCLFRSTVECTTDLSKYGKRIVEYLYAEKEKDAPIYESAKFWSMKHSQFVGWRRRSRKELPGLRISAMSTLGRVDTQNLEKYAEYAESEFS